MQHNCFTKQWLDLFKADHFLFIVYCCLAQVLYCERFTLKYGSTGSQPAGFSGFISIPFQLSDVAFSYVDLSYVGFSIVGGVVGVLVSDVGELKASAEFSGSA